MLLHNDIDSSFIRLLDCSIIKRTEYYAQGNVISTSYANIICFSFRINQNSFTFPSQQFQNQISFVLFTLLTYVIFPFVIQVILRNLSFQFIHSQPSFLQILIREPSHLQFNLHYFLFNFNFVYVICYVNRLRKASTCFPFAKFP